MCPPEDETHAMSSFRIFQANTAGILGTYVEFIYSSEAAESALTQLVCVAHLIDEIGPCFEVDRIFFASSVSTIGIGTQIVAPAAWKGVVKLVSVWSAPAPLSVQVWEARFETGYTIFLRCRDFASRVDLDDPMRAMSAAPSQPSIASTFPKSTVHSMPGGLSLSLDSLASRQPLSCGDKALAGPSIPKNSSTPGIDSAQPSSGSDLSVFKRPARHRYTDIPRPPHAKPNSAGYKRRRAPATSSRSRGGKANSESGTVVPWTGEETEHYLRQQMDIPLDRPVSIWSLPDSNNGRKTNYRLHHLIKLAIWESEERRLTCRGVERALIARFAWHRANEHDEAWKVCPTWVIARSSH